MWWYLNSFSSALPYSNPAATSTQFELFAGHPALYTAYTSSIGYLSVNLTVGAKLSIV